MITWMQKHKKWLIVTIWISTIAFIGAGFVGWGAYSYGDKASLVAKVGDETVSVGEFQRTYSQIYAQYAQMFQGNFDREKAKMFGIDKQALQKLIQQALILNLAKEFDISVSDEELTKEITSMEIFQTDGAFDKKLYKEILNRNNLKIKDFEEGLRKDLIIKKTLALLPVTVSQNESAIADAAFGVADKIKYKLLRSEDIKVDVNETALKAYWEQNKERYKTPASYTIAYFVQKPLHKTFSLETMRRFYNDDKTRFRSEDGKILPFDAAKDLVAKELDKKETKKEALRRYIAMKKGELEATQEANVSVLNNPFSPSTFEKITQLTLKHPYLKPVEEKEGYLIVKLLSITPKRTKSFADAYQDVLPAYIAEEKRKKLLEIAKRSSTTFTGTTTDFITIKDDAKLDLDAAAAKKFLAKLFKQTSPQGYIVLDEDDIVLYDILEQKLLNKTHNESKNIVLGIKQTLFNENLIKTLQNMYDIEIYYEGL